MRPAASVIIPTRNRCATLAHTLPRVLAQNASVEIIVVDDGSNDATQRLLHAHRDSVHLKVLRQEQQRGPAVARNLGLSAAQGDVVIFLDDDIIVPPDLFAAHLGAHRGRSDLVTYGPLFVAPESPRTLVAESTEAWYRQHWRRITDQKGLRFPSDGLLAANTCVSRDLLRRAGGFDEALPSKEDTELGIRLWKLGATFQYLPDAIAQELFVKSSRDLARIDGRRLGRAEVALCRKHPELRQVCGLSALGRANGFKRAVRRMLVTSPLPLHRLAELLWSAAERFNARGAMRRAGATLLGLQHRIEFLRGAEEEAGGYAALESGFGLRLPILLYHHVGPRPAGVPSELTTPLEEFEAQVRWLARKGFRGIRPSDWIAWLRFGTPLPRRPILITFDDGYADCATHALPVLERHGFSAGIFTVTGEVGGTNSWDRAKGISSLPLMGAREIRDWSARGFEFGAHSRTHPDLTVLTSARLQDELNDSAKALAALVERRVSSFAYPYGFYNERVVDAVRGAFDTAITCDEGVNDLGTDPHLLRRTMVQPRRSLLDFACRVQFGRNPISNLRARLALRARFGAAARRLGLAQ